VDEDQAPASSVLSYIARACEATVRRANIGQDDWDIEFVYLLTTAPRIRRLNHQYRSIDSETDVLAFPRGSVGAGGDIAIALDYAQATASENSATVEAEVAYLAIHAALHLLGHDHYDDEEHQRMQNEEDTILAELGLANPRRPLDIG